MKTKDACFFKANNSFKKKNHDSSPAMTPLNKLQKINSEAKPAKRLDIDKSDEDISSDSPEVSPGSSPAKMIVIKPRDIEIQKGRWDINPTLNFIHNKTNSENIMKHIFSKDYSVESGNVRFKSEKLGCFAENSSNASPMRIEEDWNNSNSFPSKKEQMQTFFNSQSKWIYG
jgi:hypothetical protein